jgi:methionyl-tRNA formyltransferase
LIERSVWKKDLIDQLIADKNDVVLLFGARSFIAQMKAIVREYGLRIRKEIKTHTSYIKTIRLCKNYKKKIPVYNLSNLNSKASENIIRRLNPDIVILLGSGIIRKNILDIPGPEFIHCHHGYLPLFRGINTAEWNLLLKGEVFLTTHFVEPGIDTGKIIYRYKIDLSDICSITELRRKCREESVKAILHTIKLFKSGFDGFIGQESGEGRQYYSMHPLFKKIIENKLLANVNNNSR